MSAPTISPTTKQAEPNTNTIPTELIRALISSTFTTPDPLHDQPSSNAPFISISSTPSSEHLEQVPQTPQSLQLKTAQSDDPTVGDDVKHPHQDQQPQPDSSEISQLKQMFQSVQCKACTSVLPPEPNQAASRVRLDLPEPILEQVTEAATLEPMMILLNAPIKPVGQVIMDSGATDGFNRYDSPLHITGSVVPLPHQTEIGQGSTVISATEAGLNLLVVPDLRDHDTGLVWIWPSTLSNDFRPNLSLMGHVLAHLLDIRFVDNPPHLELPSYCFKQPNNVEDHLQSSPHDPAQLPPGIHAFELPRQQNGLFQVPCCQLNQFKHLVSLTTLSPFSLESELERIKTYAPHFKNLKAEDLKLPTDSTPTSAPSSDPLHALLTSIDQDPHTARRACTDYAASMLAADQTLSEALCLLTAEFTILDHDALDAQQPAALAAAMTRRPRRQPDSGLALPKKSIFFGKRREPPKPSSAQWPPLLDENSEAFQQKLLDVNFMRDHWPVSNEALERTLLCNPLPGTQTGDTRYLSLLPVDPRRQALLPDVGHHSFLPEMTPQEESYNDGEHISLDGAIINVKPKVHPKFNRYKGYFCFTDVNTGRIWTELFKSQSAEETLAAILFIISMIRLRYNRRVRAFSVDCASTHRSSEYLDHLKNKLNIKIILRGRDRQHHSNPAESAIGRINTMSGRLMYGLHHVVINGHEIQPLTYWPPAVLLAAEVLATIASSRLARVSDIIATPEQILHSDIRRKCPPPLPLGTLCFYNPRNVSKHSTFTQKGIFIAVTSWNRAISTGSALVENLVELCLQDIQTGELIITGNYQPVIQHADYRRHQVRRLVAHAQDTRAILPQRPDEGISEQPLPFVDPEIVFDPVPSTVAAAVPPPPTIAHPERPLTPTHKRRRHRRRRSKSRHSDTEAPTPSNDDASPTEASTTSDDDSSPTLPSKMKSGKCQDFSTPQAKRAPPPPPKQPIIPPRPETIPTRGDKIQIRWDTGWHDAVVAKTQADKAGPGSKYRLMDDHGHPVPLAEIRVIEDLGSPTRERYQVWLSLSRYGTHWRLAPAPTNAYPSQSPSLLELAASSLPDASKSVARQLTALLLDANKPEVEPIYEHLLQSDDVLFEGVSPAVSHEGVDSSEHGKTAHSKTFAETMLPMIDLLDPTQPDLPTDPDQKRQALEQIVKLHHTYSHCKNTKDFIAAGGSASTLKACLEAGVLRIDKEALSGHNFMELLTLQISEPTVDLPSISPLFLEKQLLAHDIAPCRSPSTDAEADTVDDADTYATTIGQCLATVLDINVGAEQLEEIYLRPDKVCDGTDGNPHHFGQNCNPNIDHMDELLNYDLSQCEGIYLQYDRSPQDQASSATGTFCFATGEFKATDQHPGDGPDVEDSHLTYDAEKIRELSGYEESEKRKFLEAIVKEFSGLAQKGVLRLAIVPEGNKAIPTKLVLKIKRLSDGS
mmetsp:Transcript_14371/g.19206  ORF Transcript_14371/g.19206 Transcript_14371/m.19206 type:complete len:1446 (-) Transcript_14371:2671-7008(-)